MKRSILYIISLIVLSALATSCADDYLTGQSYEGPVSLKISMCLPGNDAAITRSGDSDGTDAGIPSESYMDEKDLCVLIFVDNELIENVNNLQLSGNNGDAIRTLTATTSRTYKSAFEIILLSNLKSRNITFNFDALKNQSKQTVYQALKFAYSNNSGDVWKVDTKQRIPMWGACTISAPAQNNNCVINLYRAIAKVNIANAANNFTLKSVRVYYANQEGYAAPLTEPVDNKPVESPSVVGIGQYDIKVSQEFTDLNNSSTNMVYIPEADNTNLSNSRKPVCLVIGGFYNGSGLVGNSKESYYRVDFKNNEGVYNVLRNYLYQFTINSVSNPGTPTPEDALSKEVVGLDVTLEAWSEISMNALTDQYTLITDRSWITYGREDAGKSVTVEVETNYGEGWTIPEDEIVGTWFTVVKQGNKAVVTAKSVNNGAMRSGSFYIKSGALKKKIYLEQEQPETANCYVVDYGAGQHMAVVVKGNGTSGLFAESSDMAHPIVQLDESAELEPDYLKVIWETSEGMIQLVDPINGVSDKAGYNKETGLLAFNVIDKGGSLPYYPTPNNSNNIAHAKGGNALIGAFKVVNGKEQVIWSWHIWVCPEMAKGIKIQNWTLNQYTVIDRNLGALSNEPGVASLGLLYQWGRKDPFIGANAISDNAERLATVNLSGYDWGVGTVADKDVDYTIKNPTKLTWEGLSVTETQVGPYLWGTNGGLDRAGVKDLGVKTIYDPCPIGYRVPPVDAFVFDGTIEYVPSGFDEYFPEYTSGDIERVGTECWERFYYNNFGTIEGPARVRATKIQFGKEIYAFEYDDLVAGQTKSYNAQDGNAAMVGRSRKTKTLFLKKSSETKNWAENLVYVPNNTSNPAIDDIAMWSDARLFATGNDYGYIKWDKSNYLFVENAEFLKNAPYYGYYLNYREVKVPQMAQKGDYYTVKDSKNYAWFPLSGAYDPQNKKGMTFEGVTIEQGPSLTVNSFVWTNSSVKGQDDNKVRPGAMFLHGANGSDDENRRADGRHIHALIRDDIKAEPRYAGAVRCVRNDKKSFEELNKISNTKIELGGGVNDYNASKAIVLYSYSDNWKIIDPGASWIKISPDRGIADKGRGQNITFKVTTDNKTGYDRTTNVKIQAGSSIFTVEITQYKF